MRMAVVVIAGLFSAVSLAQASNPKPADAAPTAVTATTSEPSVAVSSRTSTGRPADLDPRIPWLDDLQMPQSGGQDVLVPVSSFSVNDMLVNARGFVLLGSGNLLAYDAPRLRKYAQTGSVLWTVTASGVGGQLLPICWLLEGEDETVYLVACRTNEIQAVDRNGNLLGSWKWPERRAWADLEDAVYCRGIIIGDLWDGRRLLVRIRSDAASLVDDVVTPRDLEIRLLELRIPKAVRVRDEERFGKVVEENQKRTRRVRGLDGRKIDLQHSPFGGGIRETVRGIRADGQVFISSVIENPLGLGTKELVDHNNGLEKFRDMLLWYDSRGKLLRYLILVRYQEASVSGTRVCLLRDGEIQIWEPLNR